MTPICHRLLVEAPATAWGAAQVACRVVGALALIACAAQAGDWPTRSITAVVPYAAGGNTDTMARIASERLTAVLGQPVIVENVAGASGAIGATRVAQAAPDGNTLLFASASQIIIAPLVQKTHYDPQKDFVPVSIVGAGPYILGVKASLPANTFQEFIAYARDNPGKLNYASAGPGGIIHLTTALLAARAGIQMTHVPYKSGAPALNGLLTGEVDVYFGNASELLQQAASGRVRLLAVSSAARLKQLPDMPTIGEFYPGFLVTSWNGFFAPTGTPQPIVRLLARETRNAAKDPAIADRLLKLGIEPSGADPEEFAEVIRVERDFYRAAAAAAGIKMAGCSKSGRGCGAPGRYCPRDHRCRAVGWPVAPALGRGLSPKHHSCPCRSRTRGCCRASPTETAAKRYGQATRPRRRGGFFSARLYRIVLPVGDRHVADDRWQKTAANHGGKAGCSRSSARSGLCSLSQSSCWPFPPRRRITPRGP